MGEGLKGRMRGKVVVVERFEVEGKYLEGEEEEIKKRTWTLWSDGD